MKVFSSMTSTSRHSPLALFCVLVRRGSTDVRRRGRRNEGCYRLGTPPVVPEVVNDCLLGIRYRDDELFLDSGRQPPRPDQRGRSDGAPGLHYLDYVGGVVNPRPVLVDGEVRAELDSRSHHVSNLSKVPVDQVLLGEVRVRPHANLLHLLCPQPLTLLRFDPQDLFLCQVVGLHQVEDEGGVELEVFRLGDSQRLSVVSLPEESPRSLYVPDDYPILEEPPRGLPL